MTLAASCCGLIFGSLSFQISVGEILVVFDITWIYCAIVLMLNLMDALLVSEYLAENLISGRA
ncbi:MAG: hypothetical protein WDM78_21030 [Puia sp.]